MKHYTELRKLCHRRFVWLFAASVREMMIWKISFYRNDFFLVFGAQNMTGHYLQKAVTQLVCLRSSFLLLSHFEWRVKFGQRRLPWGLKTDNRQDESLSDRSRTQSIGTCTSVCMAESTSMVNGPRAARQQFQAAKEGSLWCGCLLFRITVKIFFASLETQTTNFLVWWKKKSLAPSLLQHPGTQENIVEWKAFIDIIILLILVVMGDICTHALETKMIQDWMRRTRHLTLHGRKRQVKAPLVSSFASRHSRRDGFYSSESCIHAGRRDKESYMWFQVTITAKVEFMEKLQGLENHLRGGKQSIVVARRGRIQTVWVFSGALLIARSDFTSHSAMLSVCLVVCLSIAGPVLNWPPPYPPTNSI